MTIIFFLIHFFILMFILPSSNNIILISVPLRLSKVLMVACEELRGTQQKANIMFCDQTTWQTF